MDYYTIGLAVEQFKLGNVAYFGTILEAMSPRDKELVESYIDLRFSSPFKAPYSAKSDVQATLHRETD